MKTPEVEAAMAWAVLAYNGDTIGEAAAELLRSLATPDIDQFSDDTERLHDGALRTLAAEVERLEAELAKSDEAARAAMYALDERAFLAECAETSEKRAEAAEVRVKELEELCDAEDKRMEACDWVRQYREACIKIADMHDELEAVKTQNARLREALEHQHKVAEKQVEFYKDRVDSGEEHLRPFGSEAWRRAKELKAALADGKAAP